MENEETNALTIVSSGAIFEDGLDSKNPENSPIFNVTVMKELATAKLAELKALPECDLTTEAGRKQLRAGVKPVKQIFSDFEKNIKALKKAYSEIPKKCDAVSKALRDLAELEFSKIESPFAELKQYEALTERWWKKESIPLDEYSLTILKTQTEEMEPCEFFSEKELADFTAHKATYIQAIQAQLDLIAAKKKAEAEAEAARKAEAARLAEEARKQRAIADEQAKKEKELKDQAAAIEAEKKKLETLTQAAVNPASAALTENKPIGEGAPLAVTAEMRMEAVKAIAGVICNCELPDGTNVMAIAKAISLAIREGKIPHVRYV